MAIVKPFRGLRPPRNVVKDIVTRPFDVQNSIEARREMGSNKKSFFRITKPEVDFRDGIDEYHPEVYIHASRTLVNFEERGWLKQDVRECYYVYAQTMKGHTQYGIVLCTHVDEYLNGSIKKHELTRPDKEDDRTKHIYTTEANTEPVFLTYRRNRDIDNIVLKVIAKPAEYDFVTSDGFGHHFWVVNEDEDIRQITSAFREVPSMYIADGHHRISAAVRVAKLKAEDNPHHTGEEGYNYIMATCFPHNQLTIMSYNRLVKDLNGLSTEEFLDKLSEYFEIEEDDSDFIVKPTELHTMSIYLDGRCFVIKAKPETYDDQDPIKSLDVTIVSEYILDRILNLTDLRSGKRIQFVGEIRGMGELKRRVSSGDMALAIAYHPITMAQLMTIADSGYTMPPRATWFEPKLRSGLVLYKFDDSK